MNIITNADLKKFLTLVQAGMKHGKKRELNNYTSGLTYDGTNVVKEYYVSLELSFTVDREIIDNLFAEDDFDVSNQVNDLIKGL
jgi:hypothetical protein